MRPPPFYVVIQTLNLFLFLYHPFHFLNRTWCQIHGAKKLNLRRIPYSVLCNDANVHCANRCIMYSQMT